MQYNILFANDIFLDFFGSGTRVKQYNQQTKGIWKVATKHYIHIILIYTENKMV